MNSEKPIRTYKREIACFHLLLWWMLVIICCVFVFFEEREVADLMIDILKIATIPVWAFATAAFGMDWHAKQSRWASERRYYSDPYYSDQGEV